MKIKVHNNKIELDPYLSSIVISSLDGDNDNTTTSELYGSHLDSHANMIVCGRHCFVLSVSSITAEVNAFSTEVGQMHSVPIVDAIIVHENEFTNQIYFLVARNVLYVPSMPHNLIPPFILREAGLIVNDRPLIHTDPEMRDLNDHSILDNDSDLHIRLKLQGMFSAFHSRAPTNADAMREGVEAIMITPNADWNPNSVSYEQQENALLDGTGDIVESNKPIPRLVLDDCLTPNEIEDIDFDCHSVQIKHEKDLILQAELSDLTFNGPSDTYCDDEAILISQTCEDFTNISPIFGNGRDIHIDAVAFIQAVEGYETESMFSSSIGSTSCYNSEEIYAQSPFVESTDHLDLGSNLNPSYVSTTIGKSTGFSTEHISKVFLIDKETADRTLKCTTQLCKHDTGGSLSRNFTTNDRMLRYKRINTHFFTDTFQSKKDHTSTRGYKYVQLFVSDKGFIYVVFMKKRSEFPLALKAFAKEIGVPTSLIMDPSGEQTSNEVKRFAQECSMTLKVIEESTQWANLAERYIGLLKSGVRKDMHKANCPISLWDYCIERRVRVHNVTARNTLHLDNQNPHLITEGEPADISNLARYGFYEMVYYYDSKQQFPLPQKRIGRALGPTKYEGNEMAQYILQANGRVVPRRTTIPIPEEELRTSSMKQRIETFNKCIEQTLGTSMNMPTLKSSDDEWIPYESDETEPRMMPENDIQMTHFNVSLTDALINAEVMLHQGEDNSGPLVKARVLKHLTDENGNFIGHTNELPHLNTLMYEVEFEDGQRAPYAANQIAAEIYSQVDDEGRRSLIINDIIDHRFDSKYAVPKSKAYFHHQGQKRRRKTTAGVKLLVRCSDGSETWIPLKDLKESSPVKVALYAKANDLISEPAFQWWVPYTLRKSHIIIAKIKARMKRVTHKYGIAIPKDHDHAAALDRENGNTLWADALAKEMTNVSVAFEILPIGVKPPPGWKKSSGHLIWDVKMDFIRKARWVKDGHLTPEPSNSNYAGVVSRESVRIAFTYAALNGLDVQAADIQNAYLQAPSSEKHYVICGDEFGIEHNGKVALIRRALYGGRVAGRDYWKHMRKFMNFLGFTSCKADSDVWMRKAVTDNGFEYWEYVLLYVDDCLVISHRGEDVIRNEIGKHFIIKESSIGPPNIYLGGKVRKRVINSTEGNVEAWSFSSSQYVKAAVDNVEKYLRTEKEINRNQRFPKPRDAPFSNGYRPELDETTELDPVDAAYYQSLIGILRWMVELGRVDINVEVSMLSSCLALPRYGHLQQIFNIFAYLKKHHNTEMIFDPSEPVIDMEQFPKQDWSHSVYATGDAELTEPIPSDMPEARGEGFTMRLYVDSDHAGDSITRRSRTGYFVYLQSALISWYSKKQTSVETSSFGSEFMAMKVATEYVRGLRYKLRMMGISINGPCYVYGDNKSVLVNTSVPDSTLKKKSNSIAYHHSREGTARDEWRCTYINTDDNHSDAQTKPLPFGEKRVKFCKQVLKHIYGHDEHVKNAITDVIEQNEQTMPAAAAALWMYNFVGTTK